MSTLKSKRHVCSKPHGSVPDALSPPDWSPLHPMHRRLYDHFDGYAEPEIKPYRGAVRLGVIAGSVIGSWGIVWLLYKGIASLLA